MQPASNAVQGSKAQDSSDKQARPQLDSVLPSDRQKQPSTPPGQSDLSKYVDAEPFYPRNSSPSGTASPQISHNVSLGPTQPETSDYVMNNTRMPLHFPITSTFEGSASSSRHTETSLIARQRFLDSSFGFNQFRAGSFEAQVPVWQLTPDQCPTYRAPTANHLAGTRAACPTGLLVQNPAFIGRPAGRGTRFQNGIPEQNPMRFYQRVSYTSAPAQPQQQQQIFVNERRQFFAQNRTMDRRKQH